MVSLVEIKSNEQVLAVTPVGYAKRFESLEEKLMTGFGRTHRRLPTSKLISGPGHNKLQEWVRTSIEAARQAPSAVNRQPWGFYLEEDSITVYVRTTGQEYNISKRLDCGIAMLHIEVAAMKSGVKGEWQLLKPPSVAKFVSLT